MDDFDAILLEDREIIDKFSNSHAVILLGDMNLTLLGRKNNEVTEALKRCNDTWWQWRQTGEPSDKDHQLIIRMKHSKRRLRKIQRQTEARKTYSFSV